MKEELSFSIDGSERYNRVFIDEYGADGVWLSMHVSGGNCHMVLSFDAAQEMINALQKIVEAQSAEAKKVEESTT